MKRWLTASELAELQLPGLPPSKRGLYALIEREGWNEDPHRARAVQGRGGAGWEYATHMLPELARLAYAKSAINAAAKGARGACATLSAPGDTIDGVAGEQRDARLQIVATANRFRVMAQLTVTAADALFVRLYNRGEAGVSAWVVERVPQVSMRSLQRWREAIATNQTEALASDRSQARRGTGVLDRAFDGQVRATILGLLADNEHLKARHLRAYVRDQYGEAWEVTDAHGEVRTVDVPSERTFQHTIARWKNEYAPELMRLQNPDGYRSTYQFALRVGATADHLNQLWQIDASPCDVMTVDGGKTGKQGRPNLYACIDVYSRRAMFLVSTTPTASALGLLIRKALLAWGVPDAIKSDNGADFTAKHIVRLLDNLGIHHDLCTPYQPQQKGMVERLFRTLQHDLMVTLPGFVGHNVADRTRIECRKAFAQRIHEDVGFLAGVELTNEQIAQRVDAWTRDDYEQRPHGGLRDRSPFEVAASAKGPIRTIKDEDALRVLLAPGGIRTVTKTGVRIENVDYYSGAALPGQKVFYRCDPSDMGRVWLFEPDGLTFLGEAESPELSGHDKAEMIARVKAAQRAHRADEVAAIRKESRRIKPLDVADALARQAAADAGKLVQFPKPETTHSTDALAAARDAERGVRPRPLPVEAARTHERLKTEAKVPVQPIREESDRDRFKRAMLLRAAIDAGRPVDAKEAVWLGRYQESPEFKSLLAMSEDFPALLPAELRASGPRAAHQGRV